MRLGLQSNEGDTVISTLFVRCTLRPGYCCCHSVKQLAVSACVGGKREKGVRKESVSLDCCKHGWYQTLAVGMVWEVGGATPYWIRIWFSLRPTGTVKWLLSSLYLFDVVACLCTCLNEHCIQFLSFLLPLLCGDLPFVLLVSVVPNQHDDDIIAPLCVHIFNPLIHLLEWVCICTCVWSVYSNAVLVN